MTVSSVFGDALRALAAQLRGETLDEGQASGACFTSEQKAADIGYREGWNARTRSVARMLEESAARVDG